MSFKKILASVGIGHAKVDTILHTEVIRPGEILSGEIQIQGGNVDQEIEKIDLALVTRAEAEREEGDTKHVAKIFETSISKSFIINKGQNINLPFGFQTPIDTPLNLALGFQLPIPIYLQTGLDISMAIDPTDKDRIFVEPNEAQLRILMAVQNLGFAIFKADLEFGQIQGSRLPFYQELEFRPPARLHRHLSELEVTFVAREDNMDVILEMDKRTRGLARLAYSSIDEVRGFNVRYDDLDNDWESRIEELILR